MRSLRSGSLLIAALLASSPLPADAPEDLQLVSIATGFTRPIAVRDAQDGSDRLFVAEQAGIISVVTPAGTLTTPFLDIQGRVDDTANEQGLLGLAFDPLFASNGFFYVYYTWDPPTGSDRTRISRFEVDPPSSNVADDTSETVLLEIVQNGSNHNGGNILFGPDGYLYIGMGDGGGGGDPDDLAQDPDSLHGKVLRLDVSPSAVENANGMGGDCGLIEEYAIPADNPFVGDASTCDEIWAIGLRNPWRWSFDRDTGDLFIGDVGQGGTGNPPAIEEVTHLVTSDGGGENLGWSCREGSEDRTFNVCLPGPLTDPILEYGHDPGGHCTVVGGYRFRGPIGGFDGTYVYGDYCSGTIWFATEAGGSWSSETWSTEGFGLTTFGEDVDGNLYVAVGATVYRFTSASSVFADGFEDGQAGDWSAIVN